MLNDFTGADKVYIAQVISCRVFHKRKHPQGICRYSSVRVAIFIGVYLICRVDGKYDFAVLFLGIGDVCHRTLVHVVTI